MITIELLQFTLVDSSGNLLFWCLDIENTVNTEILKVFDIRVIQWIWANKQLFSIVESLDEEGIKEVCITFISLSIYDENAVGISLQTRSINT